MAAYGLRRLGGSVDPCFPAGTPVLTPTGTRPIETLALGDEVLACDPRADGTPMVSRVSGLSRNWTRRLVAIDAGGQTVEATPNHPFWNEGEDAWLPAEALRVGARLRGRQGSISVTAVRGRPGAVATYNLEVAGLHTYFVGTQGVLVHNGIDSGWADPTPKNTRIYAIRHKLTKEILYIGRPSRATPATS